MKRMSIFSGRAKLSVPQTSAHVLQPTSPATACYLINPTKLSEDPTSFRLSALAAQRPLPVQPTGHKYTTGDERDFGTKQRRTRNAARLSSPFEWRKTRSCCVWSPMRRSIAPLTRNHRALLATFLLYTCVRPVDATKKSEYSDKIGTGKIFSW